MSNNKSHIELRVRFFLGADTEQTGCNGKPAQPDGWYWEPMDYEGAYGLWAGPFASLAAAAVDAVRQEQVDEALRQADRAQAAAWVPPHHHWATRSVMQRFSGPVSIDENPAAHGNVCEVETCRCGATRSTNLNAGHIEQGRWEGGKA